MSSDITGGWSFAVAPDTLPISAAAVWRPELLPVTVLLESSPAAAGAPLTPARIQGVRLAVDLATTASRHIVLHDPEGDHRLCFVDGAAEDAVVAAIIPLRDPLPYRLEATQRLYRRLRGQTPGPLPQGWKLTPQQTKRLTLMLRAFDARRWGFTNREIATELIDASAVNLPASIWKPSAVRAHTKRLVADASALVAGGYLRLLRGGAL